MKKIVIDKEKAMRFLLCCGLPLAFLRVMILFFSNSIEGLMNIKRQLFWFGLYSMVIFAVSLYFTFRRKVKDMWLVAATAVATGVALAVRMMFFDHASGDYTAFIDHWIHQIRELPGLQGWVEKIGDYNMPYLYLLTIVAKFDFCELYVVKTFSVIADVAVAYYLMRLASLKLKNVKGEMIVFCLALFIPTVIYNSSYWGQCDSIYTAFALAFLYYALTNKPYVACAALGISLSFKLQAIFVFPMLIVLLFAKKIKFKHIAAFPISFLLTLLPAILAGRSLADTFSIYFVQASKNENLTLCAPNIYQFLSEEIDFASFNTAALMLAGAAVLCLLFFVFKNIDVFHEALIIRTAFLSVFIMPMLLPQMHERYFYMADCLSLLIPVLVSKRWFVPIAVIYSSYRAYASFEMNDPTVNLRMLSIIMILTLVLCVADFVKDVTIAKKDVLTETR